MKQYFLLNVLKCHLKLYQQERFNIVAVLQGPHSEKKSSTTSNKHQIYKIYKILNISIFLST